METNEILDLFKETVKETYIREKDYFSNVNGRERSIVFRIAHNLANQIEGKENIYVDIEANRCNDYVKRNIEDKIIYPDLIIHQRNGEGYLAVEFKCGNRRANKDFAKLELLTMDKKRHPNLRRNCPTYQLGVFVRLKNDEVTYTFFENGHKTKTEIFKI